MLKIVKICFALTFLCLSACNNPSTDSSEQQDQKEQNNWDAYVDVDFRVNGISFAAKIPKGAYINDEGAMTHIYLSPEDEERMVIASANKNMIGKKGDFEEKPGGFIYYGDGFICAFGSQSKEGEGKDEEALKQFRSIAISIRKKP